LTVTMDGASADRRIGVMGGTFDPLHVGHLVAASEVLYALRLERIIFIPTGQPWQRRSYSDPEDRFLMTVLGVSPDPRFSVSRAEIDRPGPTYTVDTMRELREFHGPATSFFFIAGADAITRLPTWHHMEGLADLTDIVAVTRPGWDLARLKPEPGWPRIEVVEMPGIDVSATDIRARVRAGRPIDYLVPTGIARYIREHGLYLEPHRPVTDRRRRERREGGAREARGA
jgi:nicotinate-nucleotide adenylyltransferase